MTRTTQQRDPKTLRLHLIAEKLVARPDAGELFPVPTEPRAIEVLPGGVVVSGIRLYLTAVKAGRKQINVTVREDLVDEDPAVVGGIVVKDLLNDKRDVFAIGAAWAAFNAFCNSAGRPRSGYAKTQYERRFDMSPAARLRNITVATFGCSDDQLRRYAKLNYLPPELKQAFVRGQVTLRALTTLADQSQSIVDAVVAAVRAGTAPVDAIARHAPQTDNRPAPRTLVRRLAKAGTEVAADLVGRERELGYLRDAERTGLLTTKQLAETLLALPTEAEAVADVARAYTAALRRLSAGSGVRTVVAPPTAPERRDDVDLPIDKEGEA